MVFAIIWVVFVLGPVLKSLIFSIVIGARGRIMKPRAKSVDKLSCQTIHSI